METDRESYLKDRAFLIVAFGNYSVGRFSELPLPNCRLCFFLRREYLICRIHFDKVELNWKEEGCYLIVVCSHFARRLPKLPFPNELSDCVVQNIQRYKYAQATHCQR